MKISHKLAYEKKDYITANYLIEITRKVVAYKRKLQVILAVDQTDLYFVQFIV